MSAPTYATFCHRAGRYCGGFENDDGCCANPTPSRTPLKSAVPKSDRAIPRHPEPMETPRAD